jgi:hypothetical protein
MGAPSIWISSCAVPCATNVTLPCATDFSQPEGCTLKITVLPENIALFNGSGGRAASGVGLATFMLPVTAP